MKVLYVLLPQFAEHELPYLTQPLRSDALAMKENPKYENKIVAESMEPVEAISGFRLWPDYTFETIPSDYAALVLVGGYELQLWGSNRYTNAANYVNAQAVSDKNIVTANGSGHLEFACEILNLLKNEEPKEIEMYKNFYKQGLVEVSKMMSKAKPRFVFNTIGLFTTDNAKMVTFYRDIFGFKTAWNGSDPYVEMTLGTSRIIMFPRDAFEQMTSQQYAYPNGTNGTVEHSFDVPCFADVDKEYERAVDMGAKPIFAPTTEPWGQRTCYVADPEGNLIEISSFVE